MAVTRKATDPAPPAASKAVDEAGDGAQDAAPAPAQDARYEALVKELDDLRGRLERVEAIVS